MIESFGRIARSMSDRSGEYSRWRAAQGPTQKLATANRSESCGDCGGSDVSARTQNLCAFFTAVDNNRWTKIAPVHHGTFSLDGRSASGEADMRACRAEFEGCALSTLALQQCVHAESSTPRRVKRQAHELWQ